MRVLFVAYCLSSRTGNSLIGVYKRSLRIGLELVARGHEVSLFCTGRDQFSDALTRQADAVIPNFEIPFDVLLNGRVEERLTAYRQQLEELRPDVVVVGEAPLAGIMLDATVAAVGMRIPVVIIDNANGPSEATQFIRDHGPMADGVMLTGPSSFYAPKAPPWVLQVPPFVVPERGLTRYAEGGERLGANEAGATTDARRVAILCYEAKAERLGMALAQCDLPGPVEFLFISQSPEECEEKLRCLRLPSGTSVRVTKPRDEKAYFSLLQSSQLVVGKFGFMQVTECLALGSPFIGIHYAGCCNPALLPTPAREFLHLAPSPDPDERTVAEAARFIRLDRASLRDLHDGTFDAAVRCADFLETIPRVPRTIGGRELKQLGHSHGLAMKALRARYPEARALRLEDLRASRIRGMAFGSVDSIVCNVRVDGETDSCSLLARWFFRPEQLSSELGKAKAAGGERKVLHHSMRKRALLEEDRGDDLLPPLII